MVCSWAVPARLSAWLYSRTRGYDNGDVFDKGIPCTRPSILQPHGDNSIGRKGQSIKKLHPQLRLACCVPLTLIGNAHYLPVAASFFSGKSSQQNCTFYVENEIHSLVSFTWSEMTPMRYDLWLHTTVFIVSQINTSLEETVFYKLYPNTEAETGTRPAKFKIHVYDYSSLMTSIYTYPSNKVSNTRIRKRGKFSIDVPHPRARCIQHPSTTLPNLER